MYCAHVEHKLNVLRKFVMMHSGNEMRSMRGLLSFCLAPMRLQLVANSAEGGSALCERMRFSRRKEYRMFGRNVGAGVLGLLTAQNFTAMLVADDQSEEML